MPYTWRVIRNTRRIGLAYIIQQGYWRGPSTAGLAKGMNRKFVVVYEEFYASKEQVMAVLKTLQNCRYRSKE